MPRTLEIAILVERRAGRRQQNHGFGSGGRCGIARRRGHCFVERAGDLVRHFGAERRREFRRRLADQIGLADTREKLPQRFDAAGFRLAARDPVNVAKADQGLRGRIGIGRLGIVDEQHGAAPADLLHPMRQSRKRAQPGLDCRRRKPERERCGCGTGGILRIVDAAQRPDAVQRGDSDAAFGVGAEIRCAST